MNVPLETNAPLLYILPVDPVEVKIEFVRPCLESCPEFLQVSPPKTQRGALRSAMKSDPEYRAFSDRLLKVLFLKTTFLHRRSEL
jgi:hypothetical protein